MKIFNTWIYDDTSLCKDVETNLELPIQISKWLTVIKSTLYLYNNWFSYKFKFILLNIR